MKNWHDEANKNYVKPTNPEYKRVKLLNSPIKEVIVHNFHLPEENLHEYGINDEAEIVGIREDIGHFTKLIRQQRGLLSKFFNNFGNKGFWVSFITATTESSKDINRGR